MVTSDYRFWRVLALCKDPKGDGEETPEARSLPSFPQGFAAPLEFGSAFARSFRVAGSGLFQDDVSFLRSFGAQVEPWHAFL